jgi:hypothetical protein
MPKDILDGESMWFLDREDREHFLKMWKWFESRPPEPLDNPKNHRQQPPEVYIGRAPVGGIAALDQAGTGTSSDDSPQSAVCTLYAITDDGGAGTAELGDTQITRQVFNISNSDISAGTWFLAVRDKFGRWIAVLPGGGSSGEDGRWVYVTSNSGTGVYWPARLIVKDNSGNRSLGAEVRVKLLPFAGSCFVVGDHWVTRNGTVTVGLVTYELYDGKGNDGWTHSVCRNGAGVCDKLYIPHPIRLVTDVDCVTGTGSGTA